MSDASYVKGQGEVQVRLAGPIPARLGIGGTPHIAGSGSYEKRQTLR